MRGHTVSVAGRKPETFTPEENAALRVALAAERAARGLSQRAMGDLLDAGQQAVATWEKGGGFGRQNADRLAQLIGFADASAFLRGKGASPNPMTVPREWGDRELAVSIAKRLGYEAEAIRRVVVKFQEDQYKSRPARWWNDRIVIEATEMRAMALDAPAAPPVPRAQPEPKPAAQPKKRRRTG